MTKLKIFVGSSLEASAEDKFVSPPVGAGLRPVSCFEKAKN